MTKYIPSGTFKTLWEQIIEDLLVQACKNNINYCIRIGDNTDDVHILIGKKFEEYRNEALNYMIGNRIDRHKLAACICGAIIEVQPLVGYNGATIIRNANETIALYAGLNIIKFYMMYDLLHKLETRSQANSIKYIKENFDMESPSMDENICDTKSYKENMTNALYRSHHKCDKIEDICYHFDIWAYAKIFYHLEIYNKERLSVMFAKYNQSEGNNK